MIAGMGGGAILTEGLRYEGCEAVARGLSLHWPDVLPYLQMIEAGALPELNKPRTK